MDAQRVHRCVFWRSSDRRWCVVLVQLDSAMPVRGPHHCDLASDAVEPYEPIDRWSLDGRLALQLEAKLLEERDGSGEVVHNDEDVVHPQNRHVLNRS